jgi:WD40 repeat protein
MSILLGHFSMLTECNSMRSTMFMWVTIALLLDSVGSESALAQSSIATPAKQEPKNAVATKASNGSLYFDGFSDVQGSRTRFENGSLQMGTPKRSRELFPYANKSNAPIILEAIEDSELLGPDGQPGVLSLSWQTTPPSLEYSGFVYLGLSANRIDLPRVANAKTRSDLEDFQLRFRYKGSRENKHKESFKIACRIEPCQAEAFTSRVEMPVISVTDQWQECSVRLGSGSNIDGFLHALPQNRKNQFMVVWYQAGPMSDYQEGDTVLIDDVELIESKADQIASKTQRGAFQRTDGVKPIDLTKSVSLPVSQFKNSTTFPWPVAPQGARSVADVPMQVAGAISLWGKEIAAQGAAFPEKVSDVVCQQAFESLYVLHGGFYRSEPGEPVFEIILNYEGGDQYTDSIIYGEDLTDWYVRGDVQGQAPTANRSVLAWVADGKANGKAQRISFNMTEISNPYPDKIVESMELISSKGKTAGCVLAMTVGKAGRMKAKLTSADSKSFESSAMAANALDGFEQPPKAVRSIWFPRFSPDGKWLLTAHGRWEATEPGEVRMWNAKTGQVECVFECPRGVRTVDWSSKGTYFATGAYGGFFGLFRAEGAIPIEEIDIGETVEGVRFSADETRIVATLGNGDVRIYELPSLKEVDRLKGVQPGGIWGMALSPNSKLLATAGPDKHVRIFDLESHQLLHALQHPGETNGLAFSRDGKHLLSGCYDALIRVFDVETGKSIGTLRGHDRSGITDLQFSQDGGTLVSAGMDMSVRVWDVSDLKEPLLLRTLKGHQGMVFGVDMSPLGDRIVSVGWDERVVVWDLKAGTEIWSWNR